MTLWRIWYATRVKEVSFLYDSRPPLLLCSLSIGVSLLFILVFAIWSNDLMMLRASFTVLFAIYDRLQCVVVMIPFFGLTMFLPGVVPTIGIISLWHCKHGGIFGVTWVWIWRKNCYLLYDSGYPELCTEDYTPRFASSSGSGSIVESDNSKPSISCYEY